MIKVLMVSSEGVPFSKTGGLGDVIGSLPGALRKQGVDARVILPKYKAIPKDLREKTKLLDSINVRISWRNQYCGIELLEFQGVPVYFIDNEYYFGRDRLYGYYDEAERFSFFCRAVIESAPFLDFQPDIFHCHDWQTGMVPAFLKIQYKAKDFYKNVRTIFTIHNLEYQGVFPRSILEDLLDLGEEYFTMDKLEFYGNVGFMKGGLVYSDHITTVSPSYAAEILDPYFGQGLDGLLRARKNDITGILNGIDYDTYNPENDSLIFANYSVDDLRGKGKNKAELQKLLGLPVREDVPMLGLVSRLVSQKGMDLIADVINEIVSMDIQLVVLGTGDTVYENMFKWAAGQHPDKVSARILFDDVLAHRIYAGADLFLMPSRFEPCGLSQMISLRYGTLPIVRETGGLKDTVKPYNRYTEDGNGFSFVNYSPGDLLQGIELALKVYKQSDVWNILVKRAMECDHSWGRSSLEYARLYQNIL